MQIQPVLLQFLGSLAAILVLAAIAWKLKLGPQRTIGSEEEACAAAEEAASGFVPDAIAVALDGKGAIMRGDDGSILILKPHGTHLAGRILGPGAQAKVASDAAGDRLVVDTGEKRFGHVELALDEARVWVERIDAMGSGRDA